MHTLHDHIIAKLLYKKLVMYLHILTQHVFEAFSG